MAGQVLALRNLATQGQLSQQHLQGLEMENRQRAMDLQDQQVGRQAYMESGGDMDKFQQLLMQRGASPKLIQQTQMSRIALREKIAQTSEAENKVNAYKNDQLQGIFGPILQADPAKRGQLWSDGAKEAVSKGYIDRTHAFPMQYPGDDDAQIAVNHLKGGAQLLKEQLEKPQAAERQAMAAGQWTGTASRLISNAQNQEQLDQAHSDLRTMGAPASVLNRFPKTWSPDAIKQAGQLGMTPEQRTVAAENEAKLQDRQRADASVQLANATDQNDYTSKRNAMPHAMAALFPDQYNPQTDHDKILGIGTGPQGALTAGHQGRMEEHQGRMEELTERRVNLLESQAEDRKNGISPADRRQANTQIQHTQEKADALNQERQRLNDAITNGKTYIDKGGSPWNFEDYPKFKSADDKNQVKQDLIEDMVERRNGLTDRLGGVLAEKNGIYARFGVTPGESTEQSLAKLKAGDEQVRQSVQQRLNPGAKPATPQTATAQPSGDETKLARTLPQGAGKVIDKDTVRKFVVAAGGDPVKARRLAGYANWKQ